MPKIQNSKSNIINVINKHKQKNKKEISKLTIKIDKKLNNALVILSNKINISKNKLIEDILYETTPL